MRTCCLCGIPKGEAEFYADNGRKDGLRRSCKECDKSSAKQWNDDNQTRHKANVTTWRQRNSAWVKEYARRRQLQVKYGMTPEDFAAQLEEQGGVCAICGSEPSETPHVDHDHETGQVRGILCRLCNLLIGHARDSAAILRAAANYCEAHKRVAVA